MAGLFQVLWGQADGTFKTAAVLNGTDDQPLIIPIKDRSEQVENICTRPTATDWDGDGDLDLVVGNFSGTFYLFLGEGDGNFQPKSEQIMAGDNPLRIPGAHSDPFLVDWDQDGDLDLLSGSSNGGVYLAQNISEAGQQPELKQFEVLIEAGPPVAYGQPLNESELTGPVSATRIWVDDVNSDGKLDVLVGDNVTLISPVGGISKEEFQKKSEEWRKAFEAAASDPDLASTDQKKQLAANKRYRDLYNQRSKFMAEDRTGFVWLYLQK